MIDYFQHIERSFNYRNFINEFGPKMYADIFTGVLKFPITHEDGPLSFHLLLSDESKEYYLKIKGSIHKYWNYINNRLGPNGKGHNYNTFNYNDFKDTIEIIESKYKISLSNGYINVLEVGVNIPTYLKSEDIVNSYVYLFKEKSHYKYSQNSKSAYKEFVTTNFNVKIYSKSLQYSLDSSLLRFEVKHKSYRQINQFKVKNLHDLLDKTNWDNLFTHLLIQFDNTLILDPFIKVDRPQKELLFYSIFTSHQELEKQRQKLSRAGIKKRKSYFNKLMEESSGFSTKNSIRINLHSEFSKMVNGNHKLIIKKMTYKKSLVNENHSPYKQ